MLRRIKRKIEQKKAKTEKKVKKWRDQRRRILFESLESRVLLSADLGLDEQGQQVDAALVEESQPAIVAVDLQFQDLQAAQPPVEQQPVSDPFANPEAVSAPTDPSADPTTVASDPQLAAQQQAALEYLAAQQYHHDIVIVDPQVPDYQELIESLLDGEAELDLPIGTSSQPKSSDAELGPLFADAGQAEQVERQSETATETFTIGERELVLERTTVVSKDRSVDIYVLSAEFDGIDQVSSILEQYQNVTAVHILSHGSSGALTLGSGRIERDQLEKRKKKVGLWGEALRDGGDILLYGCEVAAGEAGTAFVESLAELAGVDVAASTDTTGASELGGDWVLEYASGVIESAALFTPEALTDYAQLLAVGPDIEGDDSANTLKSTTFDEALIGKNANDSYIFDDNWGADTITEEATGGTADVVDFSRVDANLLIEVDTGGKLKQVTQVGSTTNKLTGGKLTNIEIVRGGINKVDTATPANSTWTTLDFSGYSGTEELTFTISGNGATAKVVVKSGTTVLLTAERVSNIIGRDNAIDHFIFEKNSSLAGWIDGGTETGSNYNIVEFKSKVEGFDLSTPTTGNAGFFSESTTIAKGVKNISQYIGSTSADEISGGAGTQVIDGGKNDDRLGGGAGDDTLTGGAGDDTFVFNDGWGKETIIEAASGGTDTLDFSAATSNLIFEYNLDSSVTVDDGTSVNMIYRDTSKTVEGVENVEQVTGGTKVNAITFFTMPANFTFDASAGTSAILNLSHISSTSGLAATQEMVVTIAPVPSSDTDHLGAANMVTVEIVNKADGKTVSGKKIVAFNIFNIVGADGDVRYVYKDGAYLPQIESADPGSTTQTNILDYSSYGSGAVLNLGSTAQIIDPAVSIQKSVTGSTGQSEVQTLTLPADVASGSFELSYKNSSKKIEYSSDDAVFKTNLENALNGKILGLTKRTDITVAKVGGLWEITFPVTDDQQTNPETLQVTGSSLLKADGSVCATPTIAVTTNAVGPVDEVYLVSHDGQSGSFLLTVTISGTDYTLNPLNFDARADRTFLSTPTSTELATSVEDCLEALKIGTDYPLKGKVEVTGSGTADNPWKIVVNKSTGISDLKVLPANDLLKLNGLVSVAPDTTLGNKSQDFMLQGYGSFKLYYGSESVLLTRTTATTDADLANTIKTQLASIVTKTAADPTVISVVKDPVDPVWTVNFSDRQVRLLRAEAVDLEADSLTFAATSKSGLQSIDRLNKVVGSSGSKLTDYIFTNDANLAVDAGTGADVIRIVDTTAGAAYSLTGGSDSDQLIGNAGQDTLLGADGQDYLEGGTNNDILDGGSDHDMLIAGSGEYYLDGGSGEDYLDGGADNDLLLGGSGRDILIGDSGNDMLAGMQDPDKYVFDDGWGHDTIIGEDGNSITSPIHRYQDLTDNTLDFSQVGNAMSYVISDGMLYATTETGAITYEISQD
ncbi:MAG: hypothetical protein C0615_01230, partial [Desulfuromonas sp.]